MIFFPNKLLLARIWLFTAICFVLPMKASFVYVLSAFLLVVWLLEGRFAERLRAISQSKLCLAFLAYYMIYIVAMLWTEEIAKGWAMVDRQTPFLLFLLYWSSAEPEHRERYISALIAGLGVCALLANYNLLQMHWFTQWPAGIRVVKDPFDTAPFVDRILYTPILAAGCYLCLSRIFKTTGTARAIAIAMACLLIFNLSFSGGRSGMVMFVAMFILFVFEHIKKRALAMLICVIVLPTVFVTAYKTQAYFAERVDVAIADMRAFNDNPDTSVGLRLVYWTTSFHVFAAHPLLGVGSGDFQKEYTAAKPAKWAMTPDSFNPHNQFLMTAVTTGLLGLSLLLAIFYLAAKAGVDVRMTSFLIGFAIVCLFESYLWRSNTALAFCAMVAVLANKNKAIST
jgi:O-antigen ligase